MLNPGLLMVGELLSDCSTIIGKKRFMRAEQSRNTRNTVGRTKNINLVFSMDGLTTALWRVSHRSNDCFDVCIKVSQV